MGYKLKNTVARETKKYQTDRVENQRRKSEDLKLDKYRIERS